MTEAIYKVGDILEFKDSRYFPERMDIIPGPFRALIIRVDDPGYEYVIYRLLMFSEECKNFINHHMSALQKDIITSAKRIGHIDISLLRFEEKEQEEPDYALLFAVGTIAQAADLKNELDKIKKENERLSNENENLKAMNDELRSSWIDCCTNCKQTEENKKLMDENAKLSLKLYDAEKKTEALTNENEKLRSANTSFSQKVKCAEKYFDSAAAALYEGREHLSIAQNNINNK